MNNQNEAIFDDELIKINIELLENNKYKQNENSKHFQGYTILANGIEFIRKKNNNPKNGNPSVYCKCKVEECKETITIDTITKKAIRYTAHTINHLPKNQI